MVGEWESDRVFLMLGPGGGEDGGTRLLPLLAARRESEMGRTAVAVGVVVRHCRKNSEDWWETSCFCSCCSCCSSGAGKEDKVASKVFMRLDEGSESEPGTLLGVRRKSLAADARFVSECMGEWNPRVDDCLLHRTRDSAASAALRSSSVSPFKEGNSVLTLSCAIPLFLCRGCETLTS